ncbi:hypothetical protein [Shimia sp.]|uniref:hypothetical protein n=1 Tax=Shimia sp. TaxID=1954381 RepID=UPI003B8DA6A9
MGCVTSASALLACGFHNYAPQPTLVERLLEAERIVLARPTSDDPFHFQAQKALLGSAENANIPFLVDTPTRRILMLKPNAQVVFAQQDAHAPWDRIIIADSQTGPVTERIVAKLATWKQGGEADRYATFAELLAHPDVRVHRLALRELDRVPYQVLRALPLPLETLRLSKGLYDPQQREFVPIRALLLGLARDPAMVPVLQRGVAAFLPADGAELGAFATALIEAQGAPAVRALMLHLAAEDVSATGQELIIEALAIHAQRVDPLVTHEIYARLGDAVTQQPTLAPAVSRQFGARFLWGMSAVVQAAASEQLFDAADRDDVQRYLALSGG